MREILLRLNEVNISDIEEKARALSFIDIQPLNRLIFKKIEILRENPDFVAQLPKNKKIIIEAALRAFHALVKEIPYFPMTTVYDPNLRNMLPQLTAKVQEIKKEFDFLVNKIPEYELPEQEYQNPQVFITREIPKLYEILYEHLFQCLDIFILEKKSSSSELEELTKQARSKIEESTSQLREIVSEMEVRKKEFAQITEAAREASGKIGVSKFARVFDNQAKLNKKASYIWLSISVLSAAGLLFLLHWTFDQLLTALENGADFYVSLQVFLAKALIFSFAIGIFWQIVKNYHVNMHLYTLNRHRQNSLASFQAFVESTEDPKIRDTVLIQATKAIFESGETGFVSSKKTSSIIGLETIKIAEQTKEQ